MCLWGMWWGGVLMLVSLFVLLLSFLSRARRRNVTSRLSDPDAQTFRYTVIQCILATDLALGPRFITAFESRSRMADFGRTVGMGVAHGWCGVCILSHSSVLFCFVLSCFVLFCFVVVVVSMSAGRGQAVVAAANPQVR